MDFFTHQEQARRATWWLVGYFVMTVVAIHRIVYMAVVAGIAASSDRLDVPFQPLAWHPTILVCVVGAVLAVISAGSLLRLLS